MIEQAFVLLDKAADDDSGPVVPVAHSSGASASTVLGAAAGSELRNQLSFPSLALKTLAGLSIVLVVGLVPLQKILTPVSSEAFVNAPVYLVFAPASGILTSIEPVGAPVTVDMKIAEIESPAGSGGGIPVLSAGGGKLWEVRSQPGQPVAKGDIVARVVGCSSASVTASVSEAVYDKLSPGMTARFNFFGSGRFYDGTVANLLGHSDASGNLAISPASLTRDAYRVVVSLPDLGRIEDCAVGRRGAVVFDPPTG